VCLAAIALDACRRFPLVVAANRDEFFHRAAARLAWWTPDGGHQPILGGRDLSAGGTWMGLTAQGRFALVTNVRRPGVALLGDGPSRGMIVPAWLEGRQSADRFWAGIALSGYAPFNLIAADFRQGECFWASSQHASGRRLERGVTVISNAAEIDAPWPKVQSLKARVDGALQESDDATSADDLAGQLFAMLADRTPAADEDLPHTGLDRERERLLSSAFIRSADGAYGTRCSTLVITERAGKRLTTHVIERTFNNGAGPALLRRAMLKDWPPKCAADEAPAPALDTQPAAAWGTVDDGELAEVPLRASKNRRVRSLIRPLR
jgi:uncharacterized protein with NRDE domain